MDTSHILTALFSAVGGWILRNFLNWDVTPKIIKYLDIPFIRRLGNKSNIHTVRGKWEQYWTTDSKNFPNRDDRHGHTDLKQFNKYCYAEFYSKGVKYILLGRIENNYVVGQWYNAKDRLGYFGTFELVISDSSNLKGKWIGHSKEEANKVNSDIWEWKKLEG